MDLGSNDRGKKAMQGVDLSVSIVNTNTRDLALDLIGSILENTRRISTEIFVVDNNSSDGSVEAIEREYAQVKVIANRKNVGFPTANNQAIGASRGRYVVIFGADALVLPEALDILVEFMDRTPQAGAVGPKILNPDGTVQISGKTHPTPLVALLVITGLKRLFPKSRALQNYYLPLEEYDRFREADQLTGACLLVRRETIEDVGLLDEGFFVYCEDVDWCLRMRQRGWKLYYLPQAQVVHYKGESSKKSTHFLTRVYYQSLRRFYQKHHAAKTPRLLNLFWLLGLRIQEARALLENALRREKKVRY